LSRGGIEKRNRREEGRSGSWGRKTFPGREEGVRLPNEEKKCPLQKYLSLAQDPGKQRGGVEKKKKN